MLRPVFADDPEVRPAAVLHHVHEAAHVDDARAVRGDLRVGGVLEGEDVHRLQDARGVGRGGRPGQEGEDAAGEGSLHAVYRLPMPKTRSAWTRNWLRWFSSPKTSR